MFASKVRNGFVPRLPRDVWRKLKDFETATCLFANLPEKKRTQWALTGEQMRNRPGQNSGDPRAWVSGFLFLFFECAGVAPGIKNEAREVSTRFGVQES